MKVGGFINNQNIEYIVEKAKKILVANLNLKLMELKNTKNTLILNDYSVSIKINGVIEAEFILSVEERLAKELTQRFVFGDLKKDEIKEYINDTIAEIANTILGNSIKIISNQQESISIETPTLIFSNDNLIEDSKLEISTYQFETEKGSLSINFVSLNEKSTDF